LSVVSKPKALHIE